MTDMYPDNVKVTRINELVITLFQYNRIFLMI
jgi:hypothetical protein